MNELTLEQVRENMTLVGKAIQEMDDLTDKINDQRWKYEMLSRDPQIAGGQIRPAQLFDSVQKLTGERATAVAVLLDLTNTTTVEAARQSYLQLLTTYQRVGTLTEIQHLIEAGFPKATDRLAEEGIAVADLGAALATATGKLLALAIQGVVPPIKQQLIEAAPVSLTLR